MVGYLAINATDGEGDRPGVSLMHEGGGQDDNIRSRADRLAALGYVAFFRAGIRSAAHLS